MARLKAWTGRWWMPSVLLATACVVPLLWLEPGTIVQASDYRDPLNPERELAGILSGWSSDNLGQPTYREAAKLFPYLSFWAAGRELGLSLTVIQGLWFVALFVLAYVSALFFLAELGRSRHGGRWARPVLALAYVFNPFTLTTWAIGHHLAFMAYACAPLWLALLLRTLERKSSFWPSVLGLGSVSLLFAPAATNPPIVITMIGIPSFLVLILLAARAVPWRSLWPRLFGIVVVCALFNAWWLIPFVEGVLSGSSLEYGGMTQNLMGWPNLANEVNFAEFLRGFGYWGLYTGYQGAPFFSWSNLIQTTPVIIASFALTASVGMPLLRRERPHPWALFAAILFVVGVFFAKALNDPLGEVNAWWYRTVPGAFLFRSAYEKFAGLIFLGVLTALGLIILRRPRGGRQRAVATLGIALVIVATSWPLWSGQVHERGNPNEVQAVVRIPASYDRLLSWSRRQPKAGMLIVPQTPTGYVKTNWGFNGGGDPIYNYSALPVVLGAPEATPQDSPRSAAMLASVQVFDHPHFLQRLGIGYVLVRHDLDPTYYPGTPSPQAVEGRLRDAGYSLVARLGQFRVYRPPAIQSRTPSLPVLQFDRQIPLVNWLSLDTSIPLIGSSAPSVSGSSPSRFCLPRPERIEPGGSTIKLACAFSGDVELHRIAYQRFRYEVARTEEDIDITMRPLPIDVATKNSNVSLGDASRELHFELPGDLAALRLGNEIVVIGPGEPTTVLGETTVNAAGPGIQELSIQDGPVTLRGGSFERSSWHGESLGFRGRTEVGSSPDATQGRRSLEVTATGSRAAVSRRMMAFRPGDVYLIRADYKVRGEGDAGIGLWETATGQFAAGELALNRRSGWNHVEFAASPAAEAEELIMFLYATPEPSSSVTVRFDNVDAYRLDTTSVISSTELLVTDRHPPEFRLDGSLLMNPRTHKLKVPLSDGSFEQGMWSGLNPIGEVRPGTEARLSTDASDGRRSLELVSTGGTALIHQRIPEFNPRSIYRLQLDAKPVLGRPPAIGVFQPGIEQFAFEGTPDLPRGEWGHVDIIIEPSPAARGLVLQLYATEALGGRSVNRIDDVRLYEYPMATQLALIQNDNPREKSVDLTLEDLQRGGPFRVPLSTGGDTWLFLPQTFDSGWKAEARHPEGKPVQVEHFVANGYSNAWRISGSGHVLVNIYYRDRWLIPAGLVCAAVAFTGVAALASISRRKRRRGEESTSEVEGIDLHLSKLGDLHPGSASPARDVIQAILDHRFLMGMALLGFGATAVTLGLGAHVLAERIGSIAFLLFGIATLVSCLKAKADYPEPRS